MNNQGQCTFAHSYEEWNVKLCGYDGNPCNNPNCLRYHPRQGQTKENCALLNRIFFPVFQPQKKYDDFSLIVKFDLEDYEFVEVEEEEEDTRDILDILREEDGDGNDGEPFYSDTPTLHQLREQIGDHIELPNLGILPYDKEYEVLKTLADASPFINQPIRVFF